MPFWYVYLPIFQQSFRLPLRLFSYSPCQSQSHHLSSSQGRKSFAAQAISWVPWAHPWTYCGWGWGIHWVNRYFPFLACGPICWRTWDKYWTVFGHRRAFQLQARMNHRLFWELLWAGCSFTHIFSCRTDVFRCGPCYKQEPSSGFCISQILSQFSFKKYIINCYFKTLNKEIIFLFLFFLLANSSKKQIMNHRLTNK